MTRLALELDEIEDVKDLLDHVAGDFYEGWDSYWYEKESYINSIVNILTEWKTNCKETVNEREDK